MKYEIDDRDLPRFTKRPKSEPSMDHIFNEVIAVMSKMDMSGSMESVIPAPDYSKRIAVVAGGGTSLEAALDIQRNLMRPNGAGAMLIVMTDGPSDADL